MEPVEVDAVLARLDAGPKEEMLVEAELEPTEVVGVTSSETLKDKLLEVEKADALTIVELELVTAGLASLAIEVETETKPELNSEALKLE